MFRGDKGGLPMHNIGEVLSHLWNRHFPKKDTTAPFTKIDDRRTSA
jgi:hypothetical protein